MEGRVQELLLPREPAPPALDIAAIEDDERLNAIVGDGRTTPRLGLSEGSPQDATLHSDDSALASLIGPRDAPTSRTSHLVEKTRSSGVLARLGDDVKLSNLIGPSQAQKGLLALAAACNGSLIVCTKDRINGSKLMSVQAGITSYRYSARLQKASISMLVERVHEARQPQRQKPCGLRDCGPEWPLGDYSQSDVRMHQKKLKPRRGPY
eukprot:s830_g4.t1